MPPMDSAALAKRMILEITADMERGVVPASVKCFAELHDYVDANTYGGTEALMDEIGVVPCIEIMNGAVPLVDVWLAARHRPACREIDEVTDTGIVLDDGSVLTFEELIGIVRELHQLSAECAWIPEFFRDLEPSDPSESNGCPECARCHGPNYTGPCEH